MTGSLAGCSLVVSGTVGRGLGVVSMDCLDFLVKNLLGSISEHPKAEEIEYASSLKVWVTKSFHYIPSIKQYRA